MKSIIVTGASGNMGQAVVKRFAQDGHKIYAVLGLGENSRLFGDSKDAEKIDTQFLNLTDETVSEGYVKGSIANDPAVATAICIVGGGQPGTLSETTGDEIDKLLKLNFTTA
ncbi:MAG TPA: SDR family oxidoreductase, partial [Saprospiraceae bacterium]|nr:SDR family oxidoreductase [Saprospiraceae bacterium]